MLKIFPSNQFKKDVKLAEKRGLNLSLLTDVLKKLASEQVLEEKYQDHALKGDYKGFRECHVQPDWLLIYQITKKELKLFLFRTGSHSDLFKK